MFRGAETYQMPFVGLIFETLKKYKDQLINLKNEFYLSNPDGEKGCYKDFQEFFEDFFSKARDKGILYSLIPGTQMYMQF